MKQQSNVTLLCVVSFFLLPSIELLQRSIEILLTATRPHNSHKVNADMGVHFHFFSDTN